MYCVIISKHLYVIVFTSQYPIRQSLTTDFMSVNINSVLSLFIQKAMDIATELWNEYMVMAILVLFIVVTIISFAFVAAVRKKIHAFPAILSVFFTFLTIAFCIIAIKGGTLVFIPSESPESAAARFMDACVTLDEETAVSMLDSPDSLYLFTETGDNVSGYFYDALKRSYSYALEPVAAQENTHATLQGRIGYLALDSLAPDIKKVFNEKLEAFVETHKKSEIYDKKNEYLPELLDSLYEASVKKVLEKPSPYYSESPLTLELDYKDGHWRLTAGSALKLSLAGGSTSGANFANNIKSKVLSGLTYIPKTYTIEENALAGLPPFPEKFGTASDPADIMALVEANPFLTEGDAPFLDPDAEFIGKGFKYYCDETILCYSWQELCDSHACTFAEVYIADPSQLRRKLSMDTFGSPIQKYGTQLADEANAVVAINGDFYKFRNVGMTVYQRQLYRFNPSSLELCHIDTNGNLLFTYAGELPDEEGARQYIEDNDILFTLAFGPVLIANGEVHKSSNSYIIGQPTTRYSRSVLCQGSGCHYLLMTINHGFGYPTTTVTETIDILTQKGVTNAYCLDGGQTAEIILGGELINHVDFGAERTVSDIIYFATALPEP